MAGFRKLYGLGGNPDDLSRQLQMVQQHAEEDTRAAREFPENEGVAVTNQKLLSNGATTTLEITHKLGRTPVGERVTKWHGRGNAIPYRIIERTVKRIVFVTTSSVSTSFDMWVW